MRWFRSEAAGSARISGAPGADAAARRVVHTSAELHRLIRKECLRTDRTGQHFSLLVFRVDGRPEPLIRLLLERLRETDEVGWLDRERVGALLVDTPTDGARIVADDVARRLDAAEVELHTYPEAWVSEERLHEEPPYPSRFPTWKRSIDLLGALAGLLVLAPLLLVIAAAVKLSSPGPVIFRQLRIGYRGKLFPMYKFRSMAVAADPGLHQSYVSDLIAAGEPAGGRTGEPTEFKIRRDPRVTRVGRFLRRWSLDELPQLFNVLRGDMSLVGPRPDPSYAREGYARWYHRRMLDVKPGITGLWQVEGRSRVTYRTMVRMDLRYSRSLSLRADLKLLARTLRAVLSGRGAY
jgi:lipopolysaccharide/colanic/teichoic acid biosynthesis glycosyltransferase